MFKAQTRLTAGASVLTVYARNGKNGTNVAASLKEGDAKANTGCRQRFPSTEGGDTQAKTAFDRLVSDATGKGWMVASVGTSRSAFSAIPTAPAQRHAGVPIKPAKSAKSGRKNGK